MNRSSKLSPGCGSRRFASEIAAEKAVERGASGVPAEHSCGGWHLDDSTPDELPARPVIGARAAPKRPRDTGPDARTRAAVMERDQYQCAACSKPVGMPGTWWSIQHRVARGQGGGNEFWNLVLLCGSATSPGCHLLCEQRDREMRARGYWLESWQDARLEPVMVCGEQGGTLAWLTADGRYSLTVPERGAAA